jgi:hypothetical protein
VALLGLRIWLHPPNVFNVLLQLVADLMLDLHLVLSFLLLVSGRVLDARNRRLVNVLVRSLGLFREAVVQ